MEANEETNDILDGDDSVTKSVSEITKDMEDKIKYFQETMKEMKSRIPEEGRIMQTGPAMPIRMPSLPPSAPKWLVFEESIYNTDNIMKISKCGDLDQIMLELRDGSKYNEYVKNKKELWKKLQHVFTFGVNTDEQQSTDTVQENGNGSNSTVADSTEE